MYFNLQKNVCDLIKHQCRSHPRGSFFSAEAKRVHMTLCTARAYSSSKRLRLLNARPTPAGCR